MGMYTENVPSMPLNCHLTLTVFVEKSAINLTALLKVMYFVSLATDEVFSLPFNGFTLMGLGMIFFTFIQNAIK